VRAGAAVENGGMLRSIAIKLASHPGRTLLFVLVFVVVAGALGGPVAGALKGSGGFAPPNSDSQRATRMLESATGAEASPGIVLLVDTPHGPAAASGEIDSLNSRLAAVPGIKRTVGPAVARDHRHALIAATLAASADDNDVARSAEKQFSSDRDVTVGGGAVAAEQINSTVTKDLGFAEERLLIAREIHDLVAHAMTAINVQAGVAAHLLERDPGQAHDALRNIKQTSGPALTELRSTLEVLRDPAQTAPLGPVASHADIDELARGLRTVGVDVDVDVDVTVRDDVPAAVQSAGYRIVQEALTNVARHAAASNARVCVCDARPRQ
jgi:signal transduction histidine kinase